MSTIVFESKHAPPLEVPAPAGGSIADICDEKNAPIPFSCRSASCGTCCMAILAGEGELSAPNEEELDVLDALGYKPPKYRLACQAQLKPGTGIVRVKSVDEM